MKRGDLREPQVVSLFSGCGGLDLGFVMAGFRLAFATDNDPRCGESHAENFPDVPFLLAGISDVTIEQIRETLRPKLPVVLVGGPPCPPFSKSRFYRKDKERAMKDPVGFETISGYFRIVRELQPDAFLLENVAGFAYDKHAETFGWAIKAATDAGYQCRWSVLNAADYGVPQIRERFFLVGTRTGEFAFPERTHQSPESSDNLSLIPLPPWRTAGDVLHDLDTEENASETGHVAGGKDHDLLPLVPAGENYLFFTKERGHPKPLFRWRSRYWSFLLKLSPSKPSWTIQARRSNNMGPFHWRNRILRISEILRLQTFPDNWYVAGSIEQQWRQIGNAVPPNLAFALASKLRQHLERETRRVVNGRSA
jgi:DNA (cytosine-5)-methyltransferase 1